MEGGGVDRGEQGQHNDRAGREKVCGGSRYSRARCAARHAMYRYHSSQHIASAASPALLLLQLRQFLLLLLPLPMLMLLLLLLYLDPDFSPNVHHLCDGLAALCFAVLSRKVKVVGNLQIIYVLCVIASHNTTGYRGS